MKKTWSLSRRLILLLSAGLSLLWLGAAAMSTTATLHEINEVLDSALQETAQRLLPLASYDLEEHEELGDRAIGDTIAGHQEYLIYQIRDARGRVMLRSHDAPAEAFAAPLVPGFADIDGRRYYTEMSAEHGLAVQVAEKAGHRTETIYDSIFWLLVPIALLLPLAGLAIYWTVGRTVAPIGAVREALRARSGTDLRPIADSGLPTELAPIVKDVNRLLERLDLALASERAFASNSAHELRTPVAAALAQLQRLSAELGPSSHQARLDLILASLRRLGNLVEKMLQLARAESGIAITGEAVDLLPVLRLLLDEFERSATGAGRLQFETRAAAWVRQIDIDAFAIVLRNLIDNALNHGATDMPVRVVLDDLGALHVINRGPVVAKAQLRQLTDRFTRGQTKAGGSGLGLAIADTILRQAGGKLSLLSPVVNQADGFEAVVDLPPQ